MTARGARTLRLRATIALFLRFTFFIGSFGTVRASWAASSLSRLADDLSKGLGSVPPQSVVVVSPVASDVPGTVPARTDELATRLATLVAGRLGGTTRAHDKAASLPSARAIAARGGALIFVAPEIAKGELRVTSDVYPVMTNGWDRIRIPAPPPRSHAYASSAIDAEIRAFLPPITLEHAQLRKAKHDEVDVASIACGDVDGDGGMELLLVGKTRVAIGHVVGDRFVPDRSSPWASLSKRVPVPMREPLSGAALIDGAPSTDGASVAAGSSRLLLVGTSDREPIAVDGNLTVRSRLAGLPVSLGSQGAPRAGCASVRPESSSFEGDLTACHSRDVPLKLLPASGRYDAISADEVTGRDGASHRWMAVRDPSPGGKLRLRRDGVDLKPIDAIGGQAVGAQIALGDLDLDGTPELVASADGPDEFVTISSVASDGIKVRRKIPAPAPVRAMTVCPPEVRGVPALVVVVGPELWIVR